MEGERWWIARDRRLWEEKEGGKVFDFTHFSTMPMKTDLVGVELKWSLKGFKGLVEKRIEREGGLSVKVASYSGIFGRIEYKGG
ncbi:hypothetical protein ACH5RR_039891 [Cinchona calisaya]|uniref:Uncharacterized protein n=1 Tax=Cinchona calisaya TaxID=153742 RepID=A0ABD2Y0U6_9GENT